MKNIRSTVRTVFPALCAMLLCTALPATAQTSLAFAKITAGGLQLNGFRQVDEFGGIDLTGYIQLKSFEYEILSPKAGSTQSDGLQTGPIKITKSIDAATPLLTKALAQNQVITMEIILFGIDPDNGTSIKLATWTLGLGRVVSDRIWMPQIGAAAIAQPCQEVQFTYQQLNIAHGPSSTEFQLAPPEP